MAGEREMGERASVEVRQAFNLIATGIDWSKSDIFRAPIDEPMVADWRPTEPVPTKHEMRVAEFRRAPYCDRLGEVALVVEGRERGVSDWRPLRELPRDVKRLS